MLSAVADWLRETAEKSGAEKLHFTARDGYVLKQVFDLLTAESENKPETTYIYNSRKSLAEADMHNDEDWLSVIGKFNVWTLSPKKLFTLMPHLFGIKTSEDLNGAKTACGLSRFAWNKSFKSISETAAFLKFARDNFYSPDDHLEYLDLVFEYFNERIGRNDLIFDIGYSGRGEMALEKLLGFPVHSAYIHSNGDNTSVRSSLTGNRIDVFYPDKFKCGAPILEHIFSEYSPSCVGYERDPEGRVVPVFEKKFGENYQTRFITELIQKNAVIFASDFIKTFGGAFCGCDCPRTLISAPLEYFLHYPTEFDADIFSASPFEDEVWGQTDKMFNLKEIWFGKLADAGLRGELSALDSHSAQAAQASYDEGINRLRQMIDERDLWVRDRDEWIKERDGIIKDQDEQIRIMLNSHTWKTGRVFVGIPGFIKRKLFKKDNSSSL